MGRESQGDCVAESQFWDIVEGGSITRRGFLHGAALTSAAAVLAACTGGATTSPRTPLPGGASSHAIDRIAAGQIEAAKRLPRDVILRLWRGWRADRGGEVITVPKGFDFFDGGISHSTPWPYTQDIPMVWYGPGVIPTRGAVSRPVTAADIAPTMAKMIGFTDFNAPDGGPMEEVLPEKGVQPKLVVVLVWDAAGNYVLDLWPKEWPHLKALLHKSTRYTRATVGSSPSTTAPFHATMGTGAFPRRHGVLDNFIRMPSGKLRDPWREGPHAMLEQTLADLYGPAMGHRARVAAFATLPWHLGMLGHGSTDPKHQPIAILRMKGAPGGGGSGADAGAEGISWGLSNAQAPFYRFPAYINSLPPISHYFQYADMTDGAADGLWRGHDIPGLKSGFDTPARIPYQNRAIEEVIKREGLGHHDKPDLLYLNYKLIDEIGHKFTSSSLEMRDCIKAQDDNLPLFIDFLNRQVGKGKWVLLITADHGHSADPVVSGGFRIKEKRMDTQLEDHFDVAPANPLVEKTRPGWLYIDRDAFARAGVTTSDVSRYLATLTKHDTAGDLSTVPTARRRDKVIQAAFPAVVLDELVGPA
jgi:type I phosphodiesterase/nucleotide pyrophosphatase